MTAYTKHFIKRLTIAWRNGSKVGRINGSVGRASYNQVPISLYIIRGRVTENNSMKL
jgi:hypothetical protein